MKRIFLTTLILLFAFFSFGQINTKNDDLTANAPVLKVTLLGTGTPQPLMDRFGPSILVEAGSEMLLFDAGRGCLQRLRQLNVSYDKLTALFFTHLHSDHIVGLPDLWLTGWLITKRPAPLKVFGPAGTSTMIDYLRKAYAFDINIRIEDDKATTEGNILLTTDIQEGVIYENNGVKVTAFSVDHGVIKPAFGYRIDYNGHAVVLSGDTKYSENLIRFAKGTDLLVHEVMIAPDTITKADPKYNITQHHTWPEQAAIIFNKVQPKLAAYSHIVKLYGRTEDEIMKRTKENYSGPVVMGEDLMSFSIGDSVLVNRWQNR
jgi:ribonuclease Z